MPMLIQFLHFPYSLICTTLSKFRWNVHRVKIYVDEDDDGVSGHASITVQQNGIKSDEN